MVSHNIFRSFFIAVESSSDDNKGFLGSRILQTAPWSLDIGRVLHGTLTSQGSREPPKRKSHRILDLVKRSVNKHFNYQKHKNKSPKELIPIYLVIDMSSSNIHSEERTSLDRGLFSKQQNQAYDMIPSVA